MDSDVAALRLVFVSPPGASAFMAEILDAVAEGVRALRRPGLEVVCHHGHVGEIADRRSVCVIVPHEYFAVAPPEPDVPWARVIAFGVEHPGTATFETSTQHSVRMGDRFEISEESLVELSRRGISAEHFQLGYVPDWDKWHGVNRKRGTDVVYMGTADPRRMAILAANAEQLAGLRCELLIPPHEPMTANRSDFLTADSKWRLLADSTVMLNLHREGKVAFEWVRGLEAIINGCLVVTEPSSGLGPLRPGEHLLIAEPQDLGVVVRAALTDPDLVRTITSNAYDLCRTELTMAASAERLAEMAERLHRETPLTSLACGSLHVRQDLLRSLSRPKDALPPLALWVPSVQQFPTGDRAGETWLLTELAQLADLRNKHAVTTVVSRGETVPDPKGPLVDVICVQGAGDGPWQLTARSTAETTRAALHLARQEVRASNGFAVARQPATEGPPRGLTTLLTTDLHVGRGRSRNALLAATHAPFVAVVDAGDQFFTGTLSSLVAELKCDPDLCVAYCMGTHGRGALANVLVPELRRLERVPYLTRGFVVRRSFLSRIGGFAEELYLDSYVDHLFWVEVARRGAPTRLARSVGTALWPRTDPPSIALLDPPEAVRRLRACGAIAPA